ncbi:MAG: YegS/Rv2252/BmrU family lipid kinase [Oscillospiraceae bacterium]
MKRLLFIYNPQAGKGLVRQKLSAILDVFTQNGYLATACPTQKPGDGALRAAALGDKFSRVVCCGGDGTLSDVVTGLLSLPKPPVLGYIPAGTTNDFSRNLSLPRGMEKTAAVAVTGLPFPCDMGKFNDKNFVYVAAFGAFTEVAYGTPQGFKNLFGHLAYLMEGVKSLGAIRSHRLTVTHDGETMAGDFIFGMVSNTVSVGGFQGLPAHQVKLDDGVFEVVLIRQPGTLPELNAILSALATGSAAGTNGIVEAFHAKSLTFTGDEELPWTLDGEYGGSPRAVTIENLPHAITIIKGK